MKFTSAFLVLAFSVTAFGQADDNGQVVQPIPVPAGERALDQISEIKLTEKTVLTTFIEQDELRGSGSVYGMGDTSAKVNCSLAASDVKLSNFNEVDREDVGTAKGSRFYISPKKSITLNYKTSSLGVEAIKPWCNGEPELCEGQPTYYVYRTIITLTDKASNEWSLSCLAPFSRELYVSDVKINGIKIK